MKWYWILAIVAAVIVVLMSRRGENAGTRAQLRSVPPAGWTDADIDTALRSGNKIEAIKMYRMIHHVGLKEAKDAVDAREREVSNPG
jgi:ribosomal protein L7/L12